MIVLKAFQHPLEVAQMLVVGGAGDEDIVQVANDSRSVLEGCVHRLLNKAGPKPHQRVIWSLCEC